MEEELSVGGHFWYGKWTESLAVGSKSFVTMTKERLEDKAKGRKVIGEDRTYELRESPDSYKAIMGY